jgi:hypothetical protein
MSAAVDYKVVFDVTTAGYKTWPFFWAMRSAIRDHRFSSVEGTVRRFQPMPYTGHALERVCVQDTCFEYSDCVVTSGFNNNTTSHGGPIREGLRVRIAHRARD